MKSGEPLRFVQFPRGTSAGKTMSRFLLKERINKHDLSAVQWCRLCFEGLITFSVQPSNPYYKENAKGNFTKNRQSNSHTYAFMWI
jgi:hypothetical protein